MSGPTPVVQRATLAVVCVATAILMLDIAVVNTALPSIGRRPARRDHRPEVGRGHLHAHAGHRRPRRRLVGRPARRAPPCFVARAGRVHGRLGRVRVRAARSAVLDAARAVQGVGARRAVRRARWPCSRTPSRPGPATGALAVYGATIGASFAVGPLVGGAADRVPRLARDLPDQRPDRHRRACWRRSKWVNESRNPNARRRRLAGSDPGRGVAGPAGLRADPGHDRGLGFGPGARRRWPAPSSPRRRVPRRRAAQSPSPMVPLSLFRDRGFTGAQVSGVRDLVVAVRDLPVRHDVPAGRARTCRRSRPGWSTCRARS